MVTVSIIKINLEYPLAKFVDGINDKRLERLVPNTKKTAAIILIINLNQLASLAVPA